MSELARPSGEDWEQMNIDDAVVKIWLPDSLDDCLTQLSERFEQSKSDLARNGLMVHLYGRFVFEQLVANRMWKLTRRVEKELVIKYNLQGMPALDDAPRPAFIKAYGKSTRDLKVWMPRKLKDGLFELAVASGVTLSEYMRRALAAYYLGRTLTDPLKG